MQKTPVTCQTLSENINVDAITRKGGWTKQNGSRFSAAYVTQVRITVKAGDTSIVREGSGAGEAYEATPGMAHDRAANAAETDATKLAAGQDGGIPKNPMSM